RSILYLRSGNPLRSCDATALSPSRPVGRPGIKSPCSLRSGAQSSSTTSRRPCSNTSRGMRREIALFCSVDIWLLLVRLQIGSHHYLPSPLNCWYPSWHVLTHCGLGFTESESRTRPR